MQILFLDLYYQKPKNTSLDFICFYLHLSIHYNFLPSTCQFLVPLPKRIDNPFYTSGCKYLFFYRLPNSNLFTHLMLFSREKPLVKSTAPGSIFYNVVFRSIIPKTKNTLLQFLLPLLFCVLVQSIIQTYTI